MADFNLNFTGQNNITDNGTVVRLYCHPDGWLGSWALTFPSLFFDSGQFDTNGPGEVDLYNSNLGLHNTILSANLTQGNTYSIYAVTFEMDGSDPYIALHIGDNGTIGVGTCFDSGTVIFPPNCVFNGSDSNSDYLDFGNDISNLISAGDFLSYDLEHTPAIISASVPTGGNKGYINVVFTTTSNVLVPYYLVFTNVGSTTVVNSGNGINQTEKIYVSAESTTLEVFIKPCYDVGLAIDILGISNFAYVTVDVYVPEEKTIKPDGTGDFATLTSWWSDLSATGTPNPLQVAKCYASGGSCGRLSANTGSSFTMSVSRHPRIIGMNPHNGTSASISTSSRMTDSTGSTVLSMGAGVILSVEKMVIQKTSAATAASIIGTSTATGSILLLDKCLITGSYTPATPPIPINLYAAQLTNNIVYVTIGVSAAYTSLISAQGVNGQQILAMNNTFVYNFGSFTPTTMTGLISVRAFNTNYGRYAFVNNVALSDKAIPNFVYKVSGTVNAAEFLGKGNAWSMTAYSNDVGITNTGTTIVPTTADFTGSTTDWHLVAGSSLILGSATTYAGTTAPNVNLGTTSVVDYDGVYFWNKDILGNSWPTTQPIDIGALRYISVSASTDINKPISSLNYNRNTRYTIFVPGGTKTGNLGDKINNSLVTPRTNIDRRTKKYI